MFPAVYYVEMQGGTVILVFVSCMCELLLFLDSYNNTFYLCYSYDSHLTSFTRFLHQRFHVLPV